MEHTVSLRIPASSIPALKGAAGAKVKDMCTTSGAKICIPSPPQGDTFAEVSIAGVQHSIRLATLLIKMAVLHSRAGDEIPPTDEYLPDKKAEADLNISVFYRETQSRAFHTLYPIKARPGVNDV